MEIFLFCLWVNRKSTAVTFVVSKLFYLYGLREYEHEDIKKCWNKYIQSYLCKAPDLFSRTHIIYSMDNVLYYSCF